MRPIAREGLAGWIPIALLAAALAMGAAAQTRRPGALDMSPAVQAMQADDSQNPAMLWVRDGEQLYKRGADSNALACVHCHGSAEAQLRGVAVRYPAFDSRLMRAVTLAQRINRCREAYQKQGPWPPESPELLAIESYLALQSRGLPLAPPVDDRLAPMRDTGARLFRQRIGQLDLSCAQCHDDNAGRRLAGSLIPQAHPTGYPIYRLEWQGLGSLQRRVRGCMAAVRAEPYAYDASELVALELYLKQRAAGMSSDAPGVRP